MCKLYRLKKLYVNSNLLSFAGIPAGIGKLSELELFSAADNRLEMLPEGLCRCGKLRKLLLNKNRLLSLPDAIHFLQLAELDVSDNADFVMPAKPVEMQRAIGAGALFYNIDFSLQHQLMLAGATQSHIDNSSNSNISSGSSSSSTNANHKDPIARKKRLKLLKQAVSDTASSMVLRGMRGTSLMSDSSSSTSDDGYRHPLAARSQQQHLLQQQQQQQQQHQKMLYDEALIRGKRWDEQLERPKLDYTEFFEDDVGHMPGVVCYEIEKFLPVPVEPALNGKFYEGDCYIVLHTYVTTTNSGSSSSSSSNTAGNTVAAEDNESVLMQSGGSGGLNWQIYYWIGGESSLDKQACAAMHSVNLRNLLGATCRTQREEQNEESAAFVALFGGRGSAGSLVYIEGARTTSGFYTVEDVEYRTRMYRVSGTQRIVLEPVPIHYESLRGGGGGGQDACVFLLDDGMRIYLWSGVRANPITRSKARLFAEKINKHERKFEAEIVQVRQGDESDAFWRLLHGPPPADDSHPTLPLEQQQQQQQQQQQHDEGKELVHSRNAG